MLKICLSRVGKKKQPSYRIIVTEKSRDPWGKFLEILGNYNPRTKEKNLKSERIKYWLSKGAQPSNTVWNMLVNENIVKGAKRKVVSIHKKKTDEKSEKKKDKEKKEDEETKDIEQASETKPNQDTDKEQSSSPNDIELKNTAIKEEKQTTEKTSAAKDKTEEEDSKE